MSTEDLMAEVLRLPRNERVRVADEILSSLEDPADEVALAWAKEIERRSQEVAKGLVEPIPWETAKAEILSEIEQRRAARPSS